MTEVAVPCYDMSYWKHSSMRGGGTSFLLTCTLRKLNWKGINSKRIVTVCLKYYRNTNLLWPMLDGSLLKWRKRNVLSSYPWLMRRESSTLIALYSPWVVYFERKMTYTNTRINITHWVIPSHGYRKRAWGNMSHFQWLIHMTHFTWLIDFLHLIKR